MMYIPALEFLFVHIHKNGGRSTRRFFRECARIKGLRDEVIEGSYQGREINNHVVFSQIRDMFPEVNRANVFYILRDPVNRIGSAFTFWNSKAPDEPGITADKLEKFPYMASLPFYVDKLYRSFVQLEKTMDPQTNPFFCRSNIVFRPRQTVYPLQIAYLPDRQSFEGTLRFSHTDTLQADLLTLAQELFDITWDKDLPFAGQEKNRPYIDMFSSEDLEKIRHIYKRDFDFIESVRAGQTPS